VKILQNKNISFTCKEYLKEGLNYNELNNIIELLNIKPSEIIRKNEKEFKDLELSDKQINDKNEIINSIIKFPKILQRPIVINNQKAVISRPPEKINEIL
tara:strand:+ start:1159 stop:1458 length:300 start_codon:yes stop_codon:yes gene_type:complete